MIWHSQLAFVSALLVCQVAAWGWGDSCSGKSDACPANPIKTRRVNKMNYHVKMCDYKWTHDCTTMKDGALTQKPPAYDLCNSGNEPSGQLPVDVYTLAMQKNDFSDSPVRYTLHGLWPGSSGGSGGKDQPYGCLNGETFDDTTLKTFKDLLSYFWPTNPKFKNTVPCFILSEWMKHGTCAVIRGLDGTAFRIPQEAYFRTAFVIANEYNKNARMRKQLEARQMEPLITTDCVQCAYMATVGWTGTDVNSVPRMSADCTDRCFACKGWDTCPPAWLNSTVELDPSNAPQIQSSDEGDGDDSNSSSNDDSSGSGSSGGGGGDGGGDSDSDSDSSDDSDSSGQFNARVAEASYFPQLQFAMPAFMDSKKTSPWERGIWRSFGAEQLGSGRYEFAQNFTDDILTVTTDSPYPQTCTYERRGLDELLLRCSGDNPHLEGCLVHRLPDVGVLEAAFLACNHSGEPAPTSFFAAMDTPQCGNFMMFRCKAGAAGCSFSPDIAATKAKKTTPSSSSSTVSHARTGIPGPAPSMLGSWRTLQVSRQYQKGLARWNFTADGQATMEWPNYASRGVRRYAVSHSAEDPSQVVLASTSGAVTVCRFQFQHQPVYSYAVLDCAAAPEDQTAAAADIKDPLRGTQWAMGRCNPCSSYCRYSCLPENNNCGAGSCDPAEQVEAASAGAPPSTPRVALREGEGRPEWCTPDDASCWPTKTAIQELERQLDPYAPRRGVQWSGYPQPQPAPVPTGSVNSLPFYGLGSSSAGWGASLRALYHYDDLAEMRKPCFTAAGKAAAWNTASEMCKAALHNNAYRDWNPFIVVFPLHERHVAAALTFAARHRLCIATAGTGHEYNSRSSCPTGGILIRTILLKDKAFLPAWDEDRALAPHGAFRFGAGTVFTEMHNFSAEHDRAVASGWCSTVGMVGWHLGGGHGPFAPSMGLGVDQLLEIEVLQLDRDGYGRPVAHKKIASRRQNPQLFWAMRGGGGGVWGVILSMTVRAHAVPDGGLSRVYMTQSGTFCPGPDAKLGYEWVRQMWPRFVAWQLQLNTKVSTQPGFFINTTGYTNGDPCTVTWQFSFEYFYAGGQHEPDYVRFRDGLKAVLQVETAQETNFKSAYAYQLSMPADKFTVNVLNPLPAPTPPSDAATGSQNSVLVSREALETKFAATMMDVLDICVRSLKTPDPTSPDPKGYRCGFHYLYTSMTGNLGSEQPGDTAIAPAFRSAVMLWNARTLTTQQCDDTIFKMGPNSYFSESSYVLHNWTTRYWGQKKYEQLLAVKKAHDPGNHFWCHHCIGDDPNDAYGEPRGVAAAAAAAGSARHDEL